MKRQHIPLVRLGHTQVMTIPPNVRSTSTGQRRGVFALAVFE
jgi:hypothetical protein